MRPEELDAVRKLAPFAAMEDEGFRLLSAAAFLQRFPEGVLLIEEGDKPDFLHVVIEGAVELFARHGDRRTTLAVAGPLSTFILAAVVTDAVHLMSGRTIAPSQILLIPSESIRRAMAADRGFAEAMTTELARGFRSMVKALKNQKLRTAPERLANYVLEMAERQCSNRRVVLPFEKALLASLLGVTRETLSRSLAALEEHGVRTRGNVIEIVDPEALSRYAAATPLIDQRELY